jgi:hypothetical protein
VIRGLRSRGEDWCTEQKCENMTDEKLVVECIPPQMLGEEEWIAVSVSVCHFSKSYHVNICIPRRWSSS